MEGPKRQIIPKRGEIYLVNFDPTIGSEIKKTRPALILQNDITNRYSPVTIVAALSSYSDGKIYPAEVIVKSPEGGLDRDSLILTDQIRTIDKQRLIRRLGEIRGDTMIKVNNSLKISLGLVEI